MKLPKDIQKCMRNRILKRLVALVILEIVVVIILFYWGNDIFHTQNNDTTRPVWYTAMLVIPFIITGVPIKMIDFTVRGTVTKVPVRSSADLNTLGLYHRNAVYIWIRTPSGKKIRLKAYTNHSEDGPFVEHFWVGDEVFHLYGSEHIITLPKPSDTHVSCAVCGRKNEISLEYCEHCGHTLIKTI